MNGLGRASAYLALFSEIGITLLVTTLLGVLAGYWIDQRLHTLPLFAMIGFFVGGSAGAYGMYRLVNRFLSRFE